MPNHTTNLKWVMVGSSATRNRQNIIARIGTSGTKGVLKGRSKSGLCFLKTIIDADTIMEIADQIFSDKIKNTLKLLDATSEAAIILQTKMENISERVKKIENTIDKLQIAILEKVGSYGSNLESIKKEMSMMQDSFSKMISPRESRSRSEKSEENEEESKRKTSRKK